MPAIGITGGISTGKSTFCACLRELAPDAKFFDADQVAHDLIDDDWVRQDVLREFGFFIFLPDGRLNRELIRDIVFQDDVKRRALEKILHPRIRKQWSALAETHRNSPDFFFADIPLLYETGGQTLCDRVVVVACSPEIERDRMLERFKIAPATADAMMKSQMSLDEKIARADHVVWNNGDREVLRQQAEWLVALWRQEQWTK
jgi:dephospho-CoA kinase